MSANASETLRNSSRHHVVVFNEMKVVYKVYIENTSWKVLAYGIYARVVDVSEIERVSAANE